ncbi:MAG: hypothetical protein E7344_06030 [Clostridiales bacterium]|nr:hypothetical protein [Clostridiales bacterium]
MSKQNSYDFITEKINALKETYPSLRKQSDEYIFTALCIKSNYYKNPSLSFTDNEINEFIVDSIKDGGADAIFTDPTSDTNNLIICQSKYYTAITFDAVRDAVAKMILFYKGMQRGEYETVNASVQRKFISLNAEVGDESKVCFVFYTSAPKKSLREERIQKLLEEHGLDTVNFEILLYFAEDIVDEIKESESRRPTVENGKIVIDQANNALCYNDEAIIVNASAFSIKELYATHSTNLLSRNLRYFIKKRDIDSSINQTINNSPDSFWFKNNGITIICDEFSIDGKVVKLKNFSIVNGGQTTTLLHKSKEINKENDLFLPCKIIKTLGETEDEKNLFSLEIAKATNSQKAIKQLDLKSNAPEQIRFGHAMRECEIYYQTKRGETIPKDYKDEYRNTDLVEIGKLCLAGIFQLPGSSRSKPSSLYLEKFYNPVFNDNQAQIASISKDLLYIDYYFRKHFITKFEKEYEDSPVSSEIIPFARNARTICIAFTALASRYYYKNIKKTDLKIIFEHVNKEKAYDNYYYDIFKELDEIKTLIPKKLFNDKDKLDSLLYNLFKIIITSGRRYYSTKKEHDNTLNETNFLKKDSNYFSILKHDWEEIESKICQTFTSIENN